MTVRPIIFSAPMVRALLDGRKMQTRRIIKPVPEYCGPGYASDPQNWNDPESWGWENHEAGRWDLLSEGFMGRLRYDTGDLLWVREAHALVPATAYRASEGVQHTVNPADRDYAAIYREGFDRAQGGIRWRPSIHMPRWASRLTLRVTDVRVQRVQDISEEEAVAEGIEKSYPDIDPALWRDYELGGECAYPSLSFETLWNTLHGPDAWDRNDWVAAITFDLIRKNVDEVEP